MNQNGEVEVKLPILTKCLLCGEEMPEERSIDWNICKKCEERLFEEG